MTGTCLHLLLVCFTGLVYSTSEPNAYEPVIYSTLVNSRGLALFQGAIREDETTVRLEPALRAYDNDTVGSARLICRYEISSSRKNIPFVIELKDRETGAADLKLKEGETLSYEKRKHYKFNVFAYDCVDPPYEKKSKRAVVTVKVEDTDHYAPNFDSESYFVDLEEGKLYERLIQVHANDDDASPEMGKICAYDLETPDVPFTIDSEGFLKNTEAIRYDERHNFILKVTARDCGGMVSKPAFININIKEACRNGWKGFPEHIEYTPGSGLEKIAENAHLQLCDDKCVPDHISVRLQLATKHIGKGCDRDTYGILSQRKLCGADEDSIDLLPSPTLTSNWTNAIPTDDGHDGDKIYAFDGKTNAVVIPDGHVDHTLREHFTLSAWMKHSFPSTTMVPTHKNGNKEHILCMSDGDGMNRHHYAWYVHGSKLVFVLRRDNADEKDLEVFRPAEWRWNLKAINDGQWHHYAISMDFPDMRLYVDGKLVETDEDNYEILDDWPLHPTDRVHFTKLVVGACWRGLEEKFTDYFQGYMAGLTLLKSRTESERVIQCLNNCQENLDFQAISEMPSDTAVSFSKDMTEFSIVGKKAADIEKVVRDVAYVNYRTFPTPGRRNYNVRTSVHCGDTEEILPLVESYVFVEHSNKPVISLSGHEIVTGSKNELKNGIQIFKDVGVHVDFFLPDDDVDDSDDEDEEEVMNNETSDLQQPSLDFKLNKAAHMNDVDVKPEDKNKVLLDMCTFRAEPVLNFYMEHLDLPKEEIKQYKMKLEGIETAAGLVILNADTIDNYMSVIRHIRYTHKEADKLYMRKFIISCSSQSGRFVSNEFEITVAPVEDEPPTVLRANIQNDAASQNLLQPQFRQQLTRGMPTTNFGMVAIIVVCVGFLMFMIVLGVLRIRAAHYRRRGTTMDDKQEMEWDNSELNIIVNPIDQELFEYEENPKKRSSLPDDSDTDDDVSECFQDDDESSEDEAEVVVKPVKTLEWDDSNLSY